jgi:hypothetical protein
MGVEIERLARPALPAAVAAMGGPERPSMPLAQRLAILTALLALILVLGATEISLSWSARSRLEDFRDDAMALANTLSALLVDIAPTGNPDSLAQGLEDEALQRLGPSRQAWIYLATGSTLTLVASSDTVLDHPADDADALAFARRAMIVRRLDAPLSGWQPHSGVADPSGCSTLRSRPESSRLGPGWSVNAPTWWRSSRPYWWRWALPCSLENGWDARSTRWARRWRAHTAAPPVLHRRRR